MWLYGDLHMVGLLQPPHDTHRAAQKTKLCRHLHKHQEHSHQSLPSKHHDLTPSISRLTSKSFLRSLAKAMALTALSLASEKRDWKPRKASKSDFLQIKRVGHNELSSLCHWKCGRTKAVYIGSPPPHPYTVGYTVGYSKHLRHIGPVAHFLVCHRSYFLYCYYFLVCHRYYFLYCYYFLVSQKIIAVAH